MQDSQWNEIGYFEAEKWKTITDMAQKNNIEIPFSCWSWACGLCLCEVVEWMEYLNSSFLNKALMELEKNEILTCISAIKDDAFKKEWEINVVLKRRI